jgi:hypothetical protein
MPIVAKSCLFCGAGGAGVLSKEHVIPQWLLKHLGLPADDKLFQGVASSADGTLSQTPRIHSSFNFVQGHVCEECNNGWMSQLEAAAKPILVPLIDGERTIESLAEEEAHMVGKWTCKTAYMHSWASPLDSPVQQDHLQALFGKDGKAMPGVTVVGMQADFKKPSCYVQTGHWPHLCKPELEISDSTPAGAYKIGLQFRHLYLLTAFWPDLESRLTLVKGVHTAIIPTGNRCLEYPAEVSYGDGPVDRLVAFCKALAVSHP